MSAPTDAPVEVRAYSVEAVAQLWSVPAKQVYALVRSGALEHFKIGKHIRISDSALRDFAGHARVAG